MFSGRRGTYLQRHDVHGRRYTMYDDGVAGIADDSDDEESGGGGCAGRAFGRTRVAIGMKAPLLRSTSLGYVR